MDTRSRSLRLTDRKLLFGALVSVCIWGAAPPAQAASGTAVAASPTKSAVQASDRQGSAPVVVHSSIEPGTTPSGGSDAGEDWKGKPERAQFSAGAMMGLGLIARTPGLTLSVTGALKIIEDGWVPDINDSVAIEVAVGPHLSALGTSLFFSTHLRWDFVKDASWTFYGLGGLGGNFPSPLIGAGWEVHPRFGIGAIYKLHEVVRLRAEASHEFTGIGVAFVF